MLRFFAVAFILATLKASVAQAQDPPLCPSCVDFAVAVQVIGSDQLGAPRNGSGLTVEFRVENTGLQGDTYAFTCTTTGGVTCGVVSPTSAEMASGDTLHVQVTFSTGTTLGTLRLRGTGLEGGATSQSWYNVSYAPVITLVVPAASGGRAVVRNRQPVVRATYLPDGSPVDTTKTALRWRTETVTTLARANRRLLEWDVDSLRWIGVGDSAKALVKACSQAGACDSLTTWVVLPNDNKPVIGFSGMPFEALGRQFSAPFGPGLSVSGAEVETGLGTPAYISMGVARSAGLVYSTRQSYPRALVPIDVEWPWPAGTPDQIKVMLWDGAVKLDSLVVASPSCTTGGLRRCRVVLQGDFASGSYSAPTRKWLRVEVSVTSGQTVNMASDSTEVVIVDRRSTVYGSGWWPAGVLKLVGSGSDRVLVGPTGSAAIYRGHGDSLYLSPPGDFFVLKKVTGGWELSPRGSLAKLFFDSNGRLVRGLDANGNKDSVVYSGSSDQVTSLRDPVGKTIAFGYDGNGKLSTFTDPAGRQTRVTIDANNRLTYDSLPSTPAKQL